MKEFSVRLLEIAGLGPALHALRLPFGKECRSDMNFSLDVINNHFKTHSEVEVNAKDMALLKTLVMRGDEHAKVLRGVMVWLEIDAPRYWWMEEVTYRVGAEILSSTSTMHGECRGLTGDELVKAKSDVHEGTHNRRIVTFSYQTLRRIYHQRCNHLLPQWRAFCEFIETLPYAKEFIVGEIE